MNSDTPPDDRGKGPSQPLNRSRDGVSPVNHPPHYTNHPSGIECIDVVEWMNFCLGNAIKYIWRADLKNGIEDLEKARWYLDREIERRKK
jgi:hypothetical protein